MKKNDLITKYNKITSDTNVEDVHDRLFYKTKTGVTGYRGDSDKVDEKQYGKDFNDFENNNGRYYK